jgi:hypothetical protein
MVTTASISLVNQRLIIYPAEKFHPSTISLVQVERMTIIACAIHDPNSAVIKSII